MEKLFLDKLIDRQKFDISVDALHAAYLYAHKRDVLPTTFFIALANFTAEICRQQRDRNDARLQFQEYLDVALNVDDEEYVKAKLSEKRE